MPALAQGRAAIEYDHAKAVEVCRAVIAANWRMAEKVGENYEDLVDILATKLWEARESYDPSKSQYVTWAGDVAWKRLSDMARSAGRLKNRAAQGEDPEAPQADRVASGSIEFVDIAELSEKLPRVLRIGPCGRNGHDPKALAAAVAYRVQVGLGWRKLAKALRRDPKLARLLGFTGKTPSHSTLEAFPARWRNYLRHLENCKGRRRPQY